MKNLTFSCFKMNAYFENIDFLNSLPNKYLFIFSTIQTEIALFFLNVYILFFKESYKNIFFLKNQIILFKFYLDLQTKCSILKNI